MYSPLEEDVVSLLCYNFPLTNAIEQSTVSEANSPQLV
jgi:hypothetical protein